MRRHDKLAKKLKYHEAEACGVFGEARVFVWEFEKGSALEKIFWGRSISVVRMLEEVKFLAQKDRNRHRQSDKFRPVPHPVVLKEIVLFQRLI